LREQAKLLVHLSIQWLSEHEISFPSSERCQLDFVPLIASMGTLRPKPQSMRER